MSLIRRGSCSVLVVKMLITLYVMWLSGKLLKENTVYRMISDTLDVRSSHIFMRSFIGDSLLVTLSQCEDLRTTG